MVPLRQKSASHVLQIIRRLALLAVLVLISSTRSMAVHEPKPGTLVFGIVPQQSATRLAKAWGPLLGYLSEKTGMRIQFATAKDFPTFEACLGAGAYDVAYMNPYHYTVFHAQSGYDAFVREKDKKLQGIMVARRDSSVNSLADLAGKSLAFPSPAAFAASIMPRADLMAQAIAFSPSYVKSHDSVYLAVAAGLFPAGGGILRTLGNMSEEVRSKLKIIHSTKATTAHAFAAHRRVSRSTVATLQDALLEVATTSPTSLTPLGMKAFQRATDRDWDDVRALNISTEKNGLNAKGQVKCPSD